jgi:adenine/guanine phosphoribosyltransferase-like PRPP-binding protein
MNPADFWQDFHPPTASVPANAYPARLDDGRTLLLPIRPLPDGTGALASLIINQASFRIIDALAADLAAKLAPHAPDIVVGLPTLGLTLAAAVARQLGHPRYLPLGTSRKFWYDETLSVPLSSVTTPDHKRLYIDPRMIPLLQGRIAVIDDVISTGASLSAATTLLTLCGASPAIIGTAMIQTARWPGTAATCLRTPLLPPAAG